MKTACLYMLGLLLAVPASADVKFHGVVETFAHEVELDSLVATYAGGTMDTFVTTGWGGAPGTTDTFDFPDQPGWPTAALLHFRVDGGLPRSQTVYPMQGVWYTLLDSTGRVLFYGESGVADRPAAGPPGEALEVCPSVIARSARFSIRLAGSCGARLEILDMDGRLARRFELAAGTTVLKWDGAGFAGQRLPGGVYVCRLTTGDRSVTRKVLLAR